MCELSTVRCYGNPKLLNFKAFTHHYKTLYVERERYNVNIPTENYLFADRIIVLCYTLYKAKLLIRTPSLVTDTPDNIKSFSHRGKLSYVLYTRTFDFPASFQEER